jgi:hypothetical protein
LIILYPFIFQSTFYAHMLHIKHDILKISKSINQNDEYNMH